MPTLQQLVNRQRQELLDADTLVLDRVASAYTLMYDRLSGDVEALTLAIEDIENPTEADIKRLPQFKTLERRSTEELDRFTAFVEFTMAAAAVAAIEMASRHSAELLALQGITGEVLDPIVMASLLDYLATDGPLYARLSLLTGSTVDNVVNSIISGVGEGLNPRVIASNVADMFGGGLTDALRNVRTVQLYAYRDTARANYMASGVVDGWIWFAELDELVCDACIAEHGSIHPIEETLDGHYNCRCAALPYIKGVTEDVQTGQEWFDGLSEAQQNSIMGDTKASAYRDGLFAWGDIASRTHNDVYGSMIKVTPLYELLGTDKP